MKRKGVHKKSVPNGGAIRRTREANEAIERVFRSTHRREMSPEERQQFGLPIVEKRQVPDSG